MKTTICLIAITAMWTAFIAAISLYPVIVASAARRRAGRQP